MIDDMLVIDAHCHASPAPTAGILKTGWGGLYQCTIEELLKRMDKNGVDMAVILPSGNKVFPEDVKILNDWCAKIAKKYSKRLIGFCIINPLHGDFSIKEIERCANLGLKGIGEITPIHHVPIDSPIFDSIVERAQELNMPITIHSDFNCPWNTPERFARLAKKYPKCKLIMAHMGMSPDLIHYVPDIVKDVPNVFLDSSATPELPESVFTRPVRELGKNRVILGSDWPTLSIECELAKIKVAEEYGPVHGWGYKPLTKEEKRHILGLNMAKILKIEI
jgi:predicted TIM-barrel fold metal-dependent hydrolase